VFGGRSEVFSGTVSVVVVSVVVVSVGVVSVGVVSVGSVVAVDAGADEVGSAIVRVPPAWPEPPHAVTSPVASVNARQMARPVWRSGRVT
jgi:hypothetical protein